MKLAMITSGFLPIPETKGGAVENLIENVLNMNEKYKDYEITVFSVYDKDAVEVSKNFNNTNVIFIKSNFLIDSLDRFIFYLFKKIFKKKNSHSYRFICKRIHYLNQVSKYLKKYDYDKVLLENHPSQYLALKWRGNAKKYSGKYYYHCHNEFVGTYKCKDIIRNTEKFICVSKYISNSLQKYLNLKNDNFLILRNGVDHTKFNINLTEKEREELRKKYNVKKNDKILLFTGRVIKEKGVKELITALKNVSYENYKLLIVGAALNDLKSKTSFELEVEELVKEMEDKISFTGFVKYNEIPKLYHFADVAILPSIWDDPAPLTVIESLICGLPIITTVSGGIPEYTTNESAILLQRDDGLIQKLGQAIETLLFDEELCLSMSQRALEVSKDLTTEVYYQNFVKLIEGEKDGR